jgi:hypothetical protein
MGVFTLVITLKVNYAHKDVHLSNSRTVFLECLTLKMKAVDCFSMSGTAHPLMQHHIPEDMILQQHNSENITSCTFEHNSAQTQSAFPG